MAKIKDAIKKGLKKITAKKEAAPEKISRSPNEEEKKITQESEGKDKSPENDEKDGGDYLRKYQYGRELPLGDPRTDPSPDGRAYRMKQALLKQPRTNILIPVDSGSDPSVPLSVTLNGYRLDLPRQTYIEVPKQVAEVVMQSQKQTIEALDQFRSNRRKDVEDAL